ncbi:hypothetical protein IH992_05320 [Candidatus Poribacteria bacterium]|nr:hypothetical protein [Candidatus Poribacteria bacterium]
MNGIVAVFNVHRDDFRQRHVVFMYLLLNVFQVQLADATGHRSSPLLPSDGFKIIPPTNAAA